MERGGDRICRIDNCWEQIKN